MRKIAIEEHFITPYYMDYLRSRKEYPRLVSLEKEGRTYWRLWYSDEEYRGWYGEDGIGMLSDLGERRLQVMDEAGIDMQVLSFNDNFDRLDPADGTALVRTINDELAAAVKRHPGRFAGLAALAPIAPEDAAAELERAVRQLGLKGALILPHVRGEYIDARKFWPVFERAAGLGVPLYLHPTYTAPGRQEMYADYPEMGGALWGYGAEAGLAAMRLIASGVFDEYPGLKIILGHMGEALPFWRWRLDSRWQHPTHTTSPLMKRVKKLPGQYLQENFFLTISGMLFVPALLCTLMSLGAEKILFAADYPFESSREAVQFIEEAPISAGDKEKIFHGNAAALLGL